MKKIFTLMMAIVATVSAMATEGDTHEFAQSVSVIVNGGATIEAITIPAQSYPVKEVRVSYNYNKTNNEGVTVSVAVGGTSWGSKTCKTKLGSGVYQNLVYTGTEATAAVVVSFVNNNTPLSGCGTFKVDKVILVEGASGTPGTGPDPDPEPEPEPEPEPVYNWSVKTYNLLQNMTDLHNGDTLFIAGATVEQVLGRYVSGNNIKSYEGGVFDAAQHTLTCSDSLAYVVEMSEAGIALRAADSAYLYQNNTTANRLFAGDKTDYAYWNIAINDDVVTIINKKNTGRGNLLCNKGSKLFSCYSAKDNNTELLRIYSNNAPAYQEKVLQPAMEVSFDGVAVGDTLDWGEVVYDDSWGTEAAPYSEMKSLTVVGTDLPENISITLTGSSAFSTYTSTLPATGGSLGVNFETNNQGMYLGTLTITCDTLSKTVVLKAKAVREASEDPSTKPTLTVSKYRVYLNPYYSGTGTTSDLDAFTFSATNLSKKLYVEWVKNNTEPTVGYGSIEVLVGDQQINAGEKAQFDGPTVEETEVYISVDAYGSFSYSSQLHFYTYADKTTFAAEYWVDLVINVTTYETPDPDPTHNPNVDTPTAMPNVSVTLGGKVLHDGQVRIVHENGIYDLRGNRVE